MIYIDSYKEKEIIIAKQTSNLLRTKFLNNYWHFVWKVCGWRFSKETQFSFILNFSLNKNNFILFGLKRKIYIRNVNYQKITAFLPNIEHGMLGEQIIVISLPK